MPLGLHSFGIPSMCHVGTTYDFVLTQCQEKNPLLQENGAAFLTCAKDYVSWNWCINSGNVCMPPCKLDSRNQILGSTDKFQLKF